MKALLVTLILVLLTGCTTVVPVTQRWPEAPGMQSMQICPQLEKLTDTATLSTVAKTVVVNYSEYYQCVVKVEAWQEWYQKQKLIHQGLK